MFYTRITGTAYEAGYQRGSFFKDNNIKLPIMLDNFQTEFGYKSGLILKKHFPEAYQEVMGVADGMGVNFQELLSWMMCMGCCMGELGNDNNEVRGCTAFVINYKNKLYYARNNDLPPFFKKGSKSEFYQLADSTKFILNTSSFINGEEGFNEHGLVVAMTFVRPKHNEIKPGINSVFIVRYLLEKAKNVTEALKLLKELPIASACNILLADKERNMVVAELHPYKMNIRQAEIGAKSTYIVTTNQFISSTMQNYMGKCETFRAKERYRVSNRSLKKIPKTVLILDYIKGILAGEFGFMCQYPKDANFETIWSTIIDLDTMDHYLCAGDPRFLQYRLDDRLKNVCSINKEDENRSKNQ